MSFIRTIATTYVGNKARKHGNGTGLMGFGVGVLAARLATRSIPGALLVGGAIVAKALYDRSKAKDRESELLAEDQAFGDQIIDIESKPVPTDSTAV